MSFKNLHENAFVLDSHCDTPLVLIEGANLGKRLRKGHFDFVRMREGGVDAVFFAIYTSGKLSPDEATRRAMQLIASTYDSIEANCDKVALAFSSEEALNNRALGLSSVFLGMENGAPIQKDLSLLRLFYDLGIRYMTLCHAANNEICDSCAPKVKRWGGLSPFGKEVVREMNRLGMLVDVSHISDESFYDVLAYSSKPVVATHSCCRSIASHPRNLTDEMITDLAAKGGVIQINFYPPFLNSDYAAEFWPLCDAYEEALENYKKDPKGFKAQLKKAEEAMFSLKRPSYKEVIDHIDHVVKLTGVDHVGLGSDFDGIEVTPEGLEGVDKMPLITKELKIRGYSDSDVQKILGGNFLRLI